MFHHEREGEDFLREYRRTQGLQVPWQHCPLCHEPLQCMPWQICSYKGYPITCAACKEVVGYDPADSSMTQYRESGATTRPAVFSVHKLYGNDLLIPRPSRIHRVICYVRGHRWAVHYWSGQGYPEWPQHEYCERCWSFRTHVPTVPLQQKEV